MENMRAYLKAIRAKFETGDASEHTHRPALEDLVESFSKNVIVINEPKRIACGAPDLVIKKEDFPIGYIEAKDIGRSLDEAERSEQLDRYLNSLENLILTDYLEFRWYVMVSFERLRGWRGLQETERSYVRRWARSKWVGFSKAS